MPELAEVEYYRKQWNPGLKQPVLQVEATARARVFRHGHLPQLLKLIPGTTLQHSACHGKQMLFQFGADHWVGIHLGMTGALRCEAVDYPRSKHDHLLLRLPKLTLVYSDPRQFGRVRYEHSPEPPVWWKKLPPGILDSGFTVPLISRFLTRHSRLPLKAALLLQEQFPGIGNWMADEILWRCQIHPRQPSGTLSPAEIKKIYRHTRQVARDALRVIGSNWSDPPDSWLFNHRWKDGGRCPKTGRPLQRETIGGRTTCWSPVWQKLKT